MCDKRDIVGKVRQKGVAEIGMRKEMNLQIRGVDFALSQARSAAMLGLCRF